MFIMRIDGRVVSLRGKMFMVLTRRNLLSIWSWKVVSDVIMSLNIGAIGLFHGLEKGRMLVANGHKLLKRWGLGIFLRMHKLI